MSFSWIAQGEAIPNYIADSMSPLTAINMDIVHLFNENSNKMSFFSYFLYGNPILNGKMERTTL